MKLGILCTMINGFGRRGYYNSQEIGLGRALARKGHEVMIYKGIDPSEKEEKVQVEKNLTIWYLPMKHQESIRKIRSWQRQALQKRN